MKPRSWFLAGTLAALLATWCFGHRQINRFLEARLFLRAESPDQKLFEEIVENSPDPRRFLVHCWGTGKVLHRQLVASFLKEAAVTKQDLFAALSSLAVAGTRDADMSVRELCLGALASRKDPKLFDCARAQLADLDPLIRLLGLDYLSKEPATRALPVAILMLDDPDLRVVARAELALARWSGEDYGVRARFAAEAATKLPGVEDANAAKIHTGVQRRKEWWTIHKTEYAPAPPADSGAGERDRPAAADFKLFDLNHKPVQLSHFRGKVVLLNFWATWCTACVAEIPDLVALQQKMGDRIAILGISLDGVTDEHGHDPGAEGEHDDDHAPSPDKILQKVSRAVKSRGINYPVLLDSENAVGGRFNGGELPTTVILDRDGRVVRRFIGERSLEVFEAMIAEASR